jgi:SAM-dependent methyltransferase
VVELAYGPGIPGEAELRLLGPLEGKRLLALGCRRPEPIVALAEAGAKVIAVDQSSVRVDRTRQACEAADQRVELHRADVADLAFLRQDSIDLAVSVYALAEVEDLNRVFRQVHRILKPTSPFVFSLPHPAAALIGERGPDGRPQVDRSYFDPRPLDRGPGPEQDHQHGISAVFTSLSRAGFRLDVLLEPEPHGDDPASTTRAWAPPTLVVRARKEGV